MENGLEAVFTLGNGVFVAGLNPAGGTFSFPLLLAFMLVGGGFCVFVYTVVCSRLQRFTVAHVVGLSWDSSPLKRRKDPHPYRVRAKTSKTFKSRFLARLG